AGCVQDVCTGGFAHAFVFAPRRSDDNDDKALRAAVESARKPKQYTSVPRPRLPVVVGSPIDKPYAEMPYPEAGYRVLAAFRIWSVIEYFFPHKDLMNEDWDAVLREFIPRFETANDAQEYQFAVTEMM